MIIKQQLWESGAIVGVSLKGVGAREKSTPLAQRSSWTPPAILSLSRRNVGLYFKMGDCWFNCEDLFRRQGEELASYLLRRKSCPYEEASLGFYLKRGR
jgi:hypothetical protein